MQLSGRARDRPFSTNLEETSSRRVSGLAPEIFVERKSPRNTRSIDSRRVGLSRSASAIPQADESNAQKQHRCRLRYCGHLEIWAEYAGLDQTIFAWLGKRVRHGRTRGGERDLRNRREPRRTSNYLIGPRGIKRSNDIGARRKDLARNVIEKPTTRCVRGSHHRAGIGNRSLRQQRSSVVPKTDLMLIR